MSFRNMLTTYVTPESHGTKTRHWMLLTYITRVRVRGFVLVCVCTIVCMRLSVHVCYNHEFTYGRFMRRWCGAYNNKRQYFQQITDVPVKMALHHTDGSIIDRPLLGSFEYVYTPILSLANACYISSVYWRWNWTGIGLRRATIAWQIRCVSTLRNVLL